VGLTGLAQVVETPPASKERYDVILRSKKTAGGGDSAPPSPSIPIAAHAVLPGAVDSPTAAMPPPPPPPPVSHLSLQSISDGSPIVLPKAPLPSHTRVGAAPVPAARRAWDSAAVSAPQIVEAPSQQEAPAPVAAQIMVTPATEPEMPPVLTPDEADAELLKTADRAEEVDSSGEDSNSESSSAGGTPRKPRESVVRYVSEGASSTMIGVVDRLRPMHTAPGRLSPLFGTHASR
jgi:hypothetical protein